MIKLLVASNVKNLNIPIFIIYSIMPQKKAFCCKPFGKRLAKNSFACKSLVKTAFGKAFFADAKNPWEKEPNGRAQIATEYLIITIFLLAIITITFAYSFINYNQNINITQANNAIDALINKADYVYSLGPENSQFTWITLPVGTQSISITHICTTAGQQPPGQNCPVGDPIKFSAINLTVSLLGGPATISWPSKAKLELVPDDEGKQFPCATNSVFCDGTYKIRVCWNRSAAAGGTNLCGDTCHGDSPDDKICLKKV
jgi:hypothetical protein